MGVTIHYRGTLDDLSQIELMEDCLLDLVYSLGGRATIWRSYADHDHGRVVRGIIIELEPGQDSFSLLVSPEGHLTPLFQIEESEKAPFDEPPYCFVKTQFGSLHGHIAVVHILDALRSRFCSNLEVHDEGEYYENRDVAKLDEKLQFLRSAIRGMAEGLRDFSLSDEAAEDPNILVSRIERIAALVQSKMLEDKEKSSEEIGDQASDDDCEWEEPSLEDEVEEFERIRRRSDARGERMHRRISEAIASGLSIEEAMRLAMEEEGLSIPEEASSSEALEVQSEEPWLESLPTEAWDEIGDAWNRPDHPAVTECREFVTRVMDLESPAMNESSFYAMLTGASMDLLGGLVQATAEEVSEIIERAHAISQLKRAVRAHGFARGAVFGLFGEGQISLEQSNELHGHLESLHTMIHELIEQAWTID